MPIAITKDEAKKILIEWCESGVKATEMITKLMDVRPDVFGNMNIPELMEELVRENKIVEIEYVLPSLNFRIKSFFLPAGTEIQSIRGPYKGLDK